MKRALAWVLACLSLPGASAACADGGGDAALSAGSVAGRAGAGSVGAAGASAGGSSAAGGGSSAAGAPTTPVKPRGSFDVSVSGLKQAFPTGTGNVKSPSEGALFRIDIPEPAAAQAGKSGKGQAPVWRAVVTPRWGMPSLFDVSQGDGILTLTGSATVKAGGITDVWQSFVLDLDTGGLATGAVSAVGQESVLADGVGVSGKLTGSLSLRRDETPPAAKPSSALGFAGTLLLPWEPVVARFAEPISSADLAAHLSVIAGGSPISPSWTFAPEMALADGAAGAVQATAVLDDWGGVTAAKLVLSPGYADPSGNLGAGFEHGLDLVSVPLADPGAPLLPKSGGAVATWGPVELGAPCEPGGCTSVGPVALAPCGVIPAGVAGRAVPPGATTLRVRFRVVFAPTDAKGLPPYLGAIPVLAVVVARPGALPTVVEQVAPEVVDLGTAAGEYPFATPWTHLDVDLPPGSGELGWGVRVGGHATSAPCDGAVTSVPTKLLVESVAFL